jgi:hypothetical protein
MHRDISIEIAGKRHLGSYVVEPTSITVFLGKLRRTSKIRGGSPSHQAATMLRELAREVDATQAMRCGIDNSDSPRAANR